MDCNIMEPQIDTNFSQEEVTSLKTVLTEDL